MNDVPRDEHLRAALRHAPDAALVAPADLSAQILAAAHRAAAEPASAKPSRRRWWALQTPWRLGASGAFATVLLAGVVGLVWRGETPGPATETVPEVVAAAPSPAAAPVTAPAPAPAPAPAAAPPGAILARSADAAKPAAPPQRALRKQDQEEKDVAREDTRRMAQLKEETARAESRVAANALQAAPPPPPASPAPAPAAETAVAARRPMADASGAVTLGRAAPAAAPALMATPRPSGPWMDALAAGGAVQWTVDGEARAPTSSWLYALAEQTQGRWRPAPGARPTAGDNTVAWKRGDQALGQLWLGAERVLWCDARVADGRCEEAALAPDVASALRKGLTR